MIETYLEGGLGNMLFQMAFTLAFSKKNHCDYYFENYSANLKKINLNHKADIDNYPNTIFRNIHNLVAKPVNIQPKIVHYCPFEYTALDYEPNCNNFYKGYFQSELFFKDYDNYIKDSFSANDFINAMIIKKYPFLLSMNCVSLHIRRGDYLYLQDFHPVLSLEYYKNAILSFSGIDKILVFTNDIKWCIDNLIDSRIIFIEEPDWMSLYIMSYCNNHIIANSSFSWWGAKLAEYKFGNTTTVIAPKIWFGPAIQHDLTNLLPDRWAKINV
jgi:hypothetical protein